MKTSSTFKSAKLCFYCLIFTFYAFTSISGQSMDSTGALMQEAGLNSRFNIIKASPEVMPVFPNGQDGLVRYISSNLRYPIWAMEEGIEGIVVIGLIIGTSGQVIDAMVLKSCSVEFPGDVPSFKVESKLRLYEGLDQAALYLVKNMPNWQPGLVDGQAVNTKISIPFTFKLDEVSKRHQSWVSRKNDHSALQHFFVSLTQAFLQGMQNGVGGIRIGK